MRSTVAILLAKELTLEWRTRESVPAMVLFLSLIHISEPTRPY